MTQLASEYPNPDRGQYGSIIFDLDGVLAEKVWPERDRIGALIPEGAEMLRYYAAQGFSIIVWTARRKVDETMIWSWLLANGLPVDRVVTEKPTGALYVDDRAFKPEWS